MTFKQKVAQHQETAGCYKPGLQALGNYSSKIKAADSQKLDGSVFLESCLKDKYPGAPFWDYMVGYNASIYFIEVHPAETKNVTEMIKKLQWLRKWLREKATDFEAAKASHHPYRWVASGRVNITRNSSQARKLAQSRISFPQKSTMLP